MQKIYKTTETTFLALRCEPDEELEEDRAPVVLELVVPGASPVSALRQPVFTAMQPALPVAVTSTVPAKVYIQLRASNTALGTAWCITATLAGPSALPGARA